MADDSPKIVVEFGNPDWLAHLGGGFWGPEKAGGIAWNWLSDATAWCVLPPLDCHRDYLLRLEAAPLAVYESLLWDFQLWSGKSRILRKVVPVEADKLTIKQFSSSFLQRYGEFPAEWEWRIVKLDRPQLRLRLNDLPLGTLNYDPLPHVQPREIVLRHELIRERNILYFDANYAVARCDVEEGAEDTRELSFRLFRMLLHKLD